MEIIASGFFLFLDLLYYLVFIDVILSWLTLIGISFRPKVLADLIDPMYDVVRKYIPTRFGIFDFTPIFILFIIVFFKIGILLFFPSVIGISQLF